MTQYEMLTDEQKQQIDQAIKKLTIDMVKGLDYGEEVVLTNNVTLSHYCEDEVIVLNITEDWIEVYQIQYSEDGNITYEEL